MAIAISQLLGHTLASLRHGRSIPFCVCAFGVIECSHLTNNMDYCLVKCASSPSNKSILQFLVNIVYLPVSFSVHCTHTVKGYRLLELADG